MGFRVKMSAAARELMYGPPPPQPVDGPEAATYTVNNCGIGWCLNRCCSTCLHLWEGDATRNTDNPECWHPRVKRETPYPHGPSIDEKREVGDGSCPLYEPSPRYFPLKKGPAGS